MTAPLIERPGIYEIPERDYHTDALLVPELAPSLSHGDAVTIMRKSPAHLAYKRMHRDDADAFPSTPAMEFGRAAHAAVLEPDSGRVVVWDKGGDWRKADAKAFRDEAKASGKIPLLESDREQVEALRASVMLHSIAGPIFSAGKPEQSLYWVDDNTGVTCRARVDWINPLALVDLKTTADATEDSYSSVAARFGYYEQAEWYSRGWLALTGEELPFVEVVVESVPPYLVRVFRLDASDALEWARRQNDAALETYAQCVSDDEWPAFPEEVETLYLPAWFIRKGRAS